ncbi:hypothetical protein BRN01_24660 [Xanthomonas oryzae pv. oryzae]|nr:hypothetical protein BRM88_24555 [Xanthomonas oryzae pv. oryzae]AXM34182.1 hypothetical protein BRN52_24600 [Xanthomonas oryzae pv. oryzae]QBN88779.1 hypothetical protein EBA17_24575 [Xanthomonas oryzae pv. oryzae]QBO00390.1 hypothetical protein EBA20_24685 [Xanthomonas oryzae pv. oryzae]QEJ69728.1 hypothetical protein BXO1_018250 [Xanthomonas oryzae pv. oryzae]
MVSDHKLFAANQAIAQERALTQQQELARGMNEPSQGGLSRWIARVWSTTPPSELDDDLHCITSHPPMHAQHAVCVCPLRASAAQALQLDPSHHHPHTPARSLETPHTAAPTSEFWWVFCVRPKGLARLGVLAPGGRRIQHPQGE